MSGTIEVAARIDVATGGTVASTGMTGNGYLWLGGSFFVD